MTTTIDLTATRIRWSVLTRAEIERVIVDAAEHGDAELVVRARRALTRRAAESERRTTSPSATAAAEAAAAWSAVEAATDAAVRASQVAAETADDVASYHAARWAACSARSAVAAVRTAAHHSSVAAQIASI